jgi:hypothetical protein
MSDDTKKHSEFEQQLPVKLTQEELLKRGAQLAQLHADAAQHAVHADSVKRDLKAKETALEAEGSRLAGVVRTGYEPRPVVVQRWHDYKRNVSYDMRTDTGEIFGERALSPDERQGVLLPFAEEKPTKKRPEA